MMIGRLIVGRRVSMGDRTAESAPNDEDRSLVVVPVSRRRRARRLPRCPRKSPGRTGSVSGEVGEETLRLAEVVDAETETHQRGRRGDRQAGEVPVETEDGRAIRRDD